MNASKVWFIRSNQILSYYRADSVIGKCQCDTFGGQMEANDAGSAACLLREVMEEVQLPHQWLQRIIQATQEYPLGHRQLQMIQKSRRTIHKVAMWIIELPNLQLGEINEQLIVRPSGLQEMIPQSLSWRSFKEVTSNIRNVYSFRAVAEALIQWDAGRSEIH
jgi:hypothetical protein